MSEGTILYIGGFQLPDNNAAALRVIANAKALREAGYRIIFINALVDGRVEKPRKVEYEGFECYEYTREPQKEYLMNCGRIISILNKICADKVIAYNYPAVALNKMRKYCRKHGVKCYADATEWYMPEGNLVFRLIKGVDTELRMRYVHSKMDGVIAISEYLFQYYKDRVKTVKIPPLVDLNEAKWKVETNAEHEGIWLIYAGSPSAQKERLDLIVSTVESAEVNEKLYLNVIGVTETQYNTMYGVKYSGNRVKFWGRVPNAQVIKMTKEADWMIVLRERNKVVQAGFPTKIPEAIACGTPVIANRFSNIDEYLNDTNSILIDKINDFEIVCRRAGLRKEIDKEIFDFRRYIDSFVELLA